MMMLDKKSAADEPVSSKHLVMEVACSLFSLICNG